ncbi:MAG: hydantoinase/oxoprolinase family protein, partial [Ilumatobacteraceae bacterium]
TVTDSQLVLGRLSPDVALAGRLTLDRDLAAAAIVASVAAPLGLDCHSGAAGIIEVANAAMEGAVRVVLRNRGDDPRDFALVAFGGAGPLHAVELARNLSIGTVVIPPHPGTLCAHGLLAADVRLDFSASELHRSDQPGLDSDIRAVFARLAAQARSRLDGEDNLDLDTLTLEGICDVRYLGQAYEVPVSIDLDAITDATIADVVSTFHVEHHRAFAFSDPDQPVEFVTFRVIAVVPVETPSAVVTLSEGAPSAVGRREVYELGVGFVSSPIWERESLPADFTVQGPAIIQQRDTTTWLPSYAHGVVHRTGNLLITIDDQGTR